MLTIEEIFSTYNSNDVILRKLIAPYFFHHSKAKRIMAHQLNTVLMSYATEYANLQLAAAKTVKEKLKVRAIQFAVSSLLETTRAIASHTYHEETIINLDAYGDILQRMEKVCKTSCPIENLVIVLHGPAGVGKSIAATYFGKKLHTDSGRLALYDKRNSDEMLSSGYLLNQIEDDEDYKVWLVDEIDTYTKPEELKVLHELLDDIKAKDTRCFIILTTNHIDKIRDLPLLRPGRVDIIREVGYLTEEDAVKVCKRWNYEWETVREKVPLPYTAAKVTQICRDLAIEEIISEETVV